MDLTEGGIRIPWIAHWPAVIASGSICAQHCMTMDWSTTVLAAAGVEPHPDYPLDDISPMPVLRQPMAAFSRPMFWRMKQRSQRALRDGDWKYLSVDEQDYLFDISNDARARAPTLQTGIQSACRKCALNGSRGTIGCLVSQRMRP